MRSFFSFIGLVSVACCASACSGGGGSSGNAYSDLGTTSANACQANWQIGSNFDAYAKTGSASLTLDGKKSELKELQCLARRNADGDVVGYAVSFADETPKSAFYTDIEMDDFKGDGVYSKEIYSSWHTETGFKGYAVTLTVSKSGRHGVAEDADGAYRLEYDCDPGDDTTTSAAAALGEPAPGTAQVTGYNDIVYEFEGVDCAYNSFSKGFDISVPGTGTGETYSFEVSLERGVPGKQNADLWYRYYGISQATPAQGSLTLSCGKTISGTFEERNTGAHKPVTMKFACPIQDP